LQEVSVSGLRQVLSVYLDAFSSPKWDPIVKFTENSMREIVKTKIVVIEDCVDTWNQAISKTSQALYKKGYVKSAFEQHCIEREKIFPTGLNTEIPIAIPHTEAEFVNESSICFLRLLKPIPFRSMEDPSQFIEVQYVLNLAISDGKKQVSMLAKVIETFQNVKLLDELAKQNIDNFEIMLNQALSES